jgi:hypothetical protein
MFQVNSLDNTFSPFTILLRSSPIAIAKKKQNKKLQYIQVTILHSSCNFVEKFLS